MEQLLDNELVRNLKVGNNINESLDLLVQRHSGIFITMVNSYTPTNERNELISDKEYYIYNAALKFDESKNTKFPTYLGCETKWMCMNNFNKNTLNRLEKRYLEERLIEESNKLFLSL